MSEPTYERIEELFELTRLVADHERDAFLADKCGSDAALRHRVEALLRAYDAGDRFLESPLLTRLERMRAAGEQIGDRIGPYILLQLIGEGGFGNVYLAEQARPVRRRVALKIIKLGMDTRQVIARFEQERQALAMMDHPGIARVFDAGATERGRPYFVMEYVEGVPITQYCDEHNLTMHERLLLFVEVCSAVQHAHQKGVIHRDLKPGNVLVTGGAPLAAADITTPQAARGRTPGSESRGTKSRGTVKVIDFGIAKAINSRLTEQTIFTELQRFIGTPEYMSPEQAASESDIDTRTDIYSLSVLLYELLTGTTPFEPRKLRRAAYDEIRRIVREEEPPKPSTRLSALGERTTTVAACRRTLPAKMSSAVRGDLDWIVMKGLEKDRTRRYASATEFAEDIARHMRNEPVSAGPPDAAYRMRKFARRNRTALAALLLVALSLLAATFVSVRFGLSEARQRGIAALNERRAVEEAGRAEEAADEALRQTGVATERAVEAVAAREHAEGRAYVAAIAAAEASLTNGNVRGARTNLEAAPEHLRGWEWRHLHSRLDQAVAQLEGHTDVVYALEIIGDGSLLASASRDQTVRLWNLATLREQAVLRGHQHPVISLAASPDGLVLASGDSSGTIRLWSLPDGQLMAVLESESAPIRDLMFDARGERLFACFTEGCRIWDVTTAARLALLPNVNAQSVTVRGDHLVLGLTSGAVVRWNWRDVIQLEVVQFDSGEFFGVRYAPDGLHLAASTSSGEALILDAATLAVVLRHYGHDYRAERALFSPDGATLVSFGWDGTIRIRDANSGRLQRLLLGHSLPISDVAFSLDGSTLYSASADSTIRVWDLNAEHEVLLRWENRVASIAADEQARWMCTVSARGVEPQSVVLWDLGRRRPVALLYRLEPPSWIEAVRLALAPDRALLAGTFPDGIIRIWSTADFTTRIEAHDPHVNGRGPLAWSELPLAPPLLEIQTEADEPMTSLALSSDGRLFVGSERVRIWNAVSGEQLAQWPRNGGRIISLAIDSNSERVVLGRHDGLIEIVNADTGEWQSTLALQSGAVSALSFSRDGRWLASGFLDGTIAIWDWSIRPHPQSPHTRLAGHGTNVASLAFTPDGSRLASASHDNTIRLWDPVAGQHKATLHGHSYLVESVTFIDGGEVLLSSSADHTVRQWTTRRDHRQAAPGARLIEETLSAAPPEGTQATSGITP